MPDRRYGGTRTGTARRVLEALPCGHPGSETAIGFPIPDAGSGTLRQGMKGWSLLRKLHFYQVICICKLHLRIEGRSAMDVNFLPRGRMTCVRIRPRLIVVMALRRSAGHSLPVG